MDYIYGKLNIQTENKSYDGSTTDFFTTSIYEGDSENVRKIAVYFSLNALINALEATPLKCSNHRYCSTTLMVGSKVLDLRGEYPSYDYEVADGVVAITNAPYTLRGGVINIQ